MSSNQFNGLTMPVFTAFGWAGEEAAVNFALSQMELFVEGLYYSLSRTAQDQFVVHGIDRTIKSAYLSTSPDPEEGLIVVFNARPMSLETSLAISDKATLAKAYTTAEAQPDNIYSILEELGPGWKLRIQQMEIDEDSGTTAHYQDLYKDGIDELDQETLSTVISRAAYLNSESKWVVPLFVSHFDDSEKVAAMGTRIISVSAENVDKLVPLIEFLTGKARKKKAQKKKAPKPRPKQAPEPVRQMSGDEEQFTYVSELKALHLRRGFINLTPEHWPFFALNVRTETRPVTIHYGGQKDQKSSVWRLVQNDQARITLSPPVHHWLEENFDVHDFVQVTAVKKGQEEIHITLAPAT
jgi:hypothetical protein